MKIRWRVALALAATCLAVWAALALGVAADTETLDDAQVRFVQISDTHFGSPAHAERARKAVKAVNAYPMKIAFVAHTGDIVMDRILDERVVDESLEIMGGLKTSVHYVPGNHDIVARSQKRAEMIEAFRKRYGPLCRRAEYGGVVFLFLYTEPLAGGFTVPGYDPLGWLERELKASGGKPVIVMHHTPSVPDFYGNKLHRGWPDAVRKRWVALLNTHNVKAVIAGHFHRDEHHWLGRVPLYVCSSIAGYWERQGSYRVYEYREGRLSYRTQYIRDK